MIDRKQFKDFFFVHFKVQDYVDVNVRNSAGNPRFITVKIIKEVILFYQKTDNLSFVVIKGRLSQTLARMSGGPSNIQGNIILNTTTHH